MGKVNQVASELRNGNRVLKVARSVDDFLRILAPFNQRALAEMVRIKVDRPSYLFRGDKNSQPLVASIGRIWSDGLDVRERNMLRHMREKFENYMGLSDWELVALARHYGAKTRFLDWSSNALVALRFALGNREERDRDEQPVVWVLETRGSDFDIPADEVMPFPRGRGSSTKIFAPSSIDSRVASQNSYMMRQVFERDVNAPLQIKPVDVNPTFAKRIWKIPIALDCREGMASELECLGYTFDVLLPKIDFDTLREECDKIIKGE